MKMQRIIKKKVYSTTLLKDVELDIYPNCPPKYLRKDGTIGCIVDRAGLKYIVSAPLLEACKFLYDLNIQTTSSGKDNNRIGISCNYKTLSEENKKIVDFLAKNGIVKITKSKAYDLFNNELEEEINEFRISIEVDLEHETIAQAEQKIMQKVKSLGLVKQDVLFGVEDEQEAIQEEIKAYTFEFFDGFKTATSTITEQEARQMFLDKGCVFVDGKMWRSQQLYNKHLEYLKQNKDTNGVKP